MAALSPELLAQRRPVWDAMSDLFLDTETRWSVPRIAQIGAASPWSIDELDRMFWVEVFPLAIGNMLELAGEWAVLALPEPALIANAASGTMPTELRARHGWMVDSSWTATKALIGILRAEPREQWATLVKVWDALGHRYFEDPTAELLFPIVDKLHDLRRDGGSPEDEWRRYEPIARAMLLSQEARAADARAARVEQDLRA